MDQPELTPGPRFRAALPHRRGLRADGYDPHHAAETGTKAMSMMQNFPEGF
jgi:hypothetical protein